MAVQRPHVPVVSCISGVLKTAVLNGCTLMVAALAFVVVGARSGQDVLQATAVELDEVKATVMATSGERPVDAPGWYRDALRASRVHWVYLVASEAHAGTLERAMREAGALPAHERGTLLTYEIEIVAAHVDAAWYGDDLNVLAVPGHVDQIRAANGLPPLRVADLR